MKPYKYDYYLVAIPGDIRTNYAGLKEVAIATAKLRVRVITLATWDARLVSGALGGDEVIYKVRRKRNKESIYV